jgi:hypothetical protein
LFRFPRVQGNAWARSKFLKFRRFVDANIGSLAYAEIYLAVATLIMRFDFELYETTREDVDFYLTLPHPKLASKYIRVLIN